MDTLKEFKMEEIKMNDIIVGINPVFGYYILSFVWIILLILYFKFYVFGIKIKEE